MTIEGIISWAAEQTKLDGEQKFILGNNSRLQRRNISLASREHKYCLLNKPRLQWKHKFRLQNKSIL
jgi:hypothetical protein